MENLSLIEGGMGGLVLSDENEGDSAIKMEMCLVGWFLSDKPIRTHIMKERLAAIWGPGKGVTIQETEPGLFLFQFYHKLDLTQILNGGPWSFDNYMLVLARLCTSDVPAEIPLNHLCCWIQVHSLPLGFLSLTVGQHLGNVLGEFVEYDQNNSNALWRAYMHIKVKLDVRVPLKKEYRVKKTGGEWKMVQFKYERLGVFCFVCGIIGHVEQLCPRLFEIEEDDGQRNWGPELRAEVRRGGGTAGNKWLRDVTGDKPRSAFNANHGGENLGNCHAIKQSEFSGTTANQLGAKSGNNMGMGHIVEYVENVSHANHENMGAHHIYTNPLALTGTNDDMDVNFERKRRRKAAPVAPQAMDPTIVIVDPKQQHFLLADPGPQARQEQ